VAGAGIAEPDVRPEGSLVYGKLVLRPTVRRACWKEVDVGLTVTEYDVVHFLTSNAGRYQTYRAIYELRYYEGYNTGLDGLGFRVNVRSGIKRIRRKFCRIDSAFDQIETSTALGYRWRRTDCTR
jgi:two-component system response regulator ChvI